VFQIRNILFDKLDKPLASFDLTDRKQLLEACHYTNLQPLWAIDNFIKNDKIRH
jgi:desulfoferrodoxin (superoxide reductase-like protein)